MTIASIAAQQSAQQAAQASATAATTNTAAGASQNALSTLSSNFQDFLGMLMTQLQNQDPTNPMDTNQFTQELVEFSGVEQQINTNSSLTQLISLTQSGQVLQSSALVGHQVQVASDSMPVQNGNGTVQFSSATSQPVTIGIYDANGSVVASQVATASQGVNSWSWNGMDGNGTQWPDGLYTVTVNTGGASGGALPVTVVGTVTGVQTQGTSMELSLGALSAPFSAIQSVVN